MRTYTCFFGRSTPSSRTLIVCGIVLLLAAVSAAGTVQGTGNGGPIPNGAFVTSGVVTSDITLNSPGYVASGNAVTVTLLGLQHDFAGDLHITLSYIDSNGNTVQSVDLINRLGATAANPYGTSADFGNDQSIGDNYQFNTDYAGNIWNTAACANPPACTTPYGDADSIPGVSTDKINNGQYFTSTTAGAKTNLSYAFSGLSVSAGKWRLTITDAADPNVGSFVGWQISVVTVASNPPATITALGGTPQSAAAGSSFASALQAEVTDSNSNPVSGLTVTFSAPSSGAAATFSGASSATAVTNSSGIATSPIPVANSTVGSYSVSAAVAGLTAASFSLQNTAAANPGPPTVVSLTPNSGSGASQTFTSVFSDPGGASNLANIVVLFNTSLSSTNGCYIYYDPKGNLLYLLNNGGTAWSTIAPGSSGQVSNSQCTLLGTGSSYTASGQTATLVLALQFSGSTQQNVYLLAGDVNGASSGWVQKGTWGSSGPVSTGPPTITSVTPNSGSGASQTFNTVAADPNGGAALSSIVLVFNTTLASTNACYVYYDVGGNTIYLLNNAGTAWSAITPGASAQVSNSQCTVAGTGSSYSVSGNNGTLNLAMQFTGNSQENIYVDATDRNGASSGWVQKGTWGTSSPISAGPPTLVSLTPNAGAGAAQTFTSVFSDPAGAVNLNSILVLFNTSLSSTNGCYVFYNPGGNTIYLLNSAGTAWSTVTPGSSGQASNSLCTVIGAGSSYTTSGNNATLNLDLQFTGSTAENIYLLGSDSSGANTGWVQKGPWTP